MANSGVGSAVESVDLIESLRFEGSRTGNQCLLWVERFIALRRKLIAGSGVPETEL